MANLQVKGVNDSFYEELKALAAAENRSISQQVLTMLREYMAKREAVAAAPTPADVLLRLAGSWEDERTAETIVQDLRRSRRSSRKLADGM